MVQLQNPDAKPLSRPRTLKAGKPQPQHSYALRCTERPQTLHTSTIYTH